jgi:putative membrane protein
MSKRVRFMSLAAICCFGLVTLGWSRQQGSSTSANSSQDNQSSMSQGSSSSASIPQSQKQFLDRMAKDSEGEVQVAKMVESKTSNQQVKDFTQKLISDHEQLDQQMQSTMSQLGISMPQNAMTPSEKQLKTRLQSLSGAQFDQAFVAAQVKDHQKDVREVKQHLQSASNPQVKGLLQSALPVLQQHLQMAQQLQSQLGGSQQASR